MSFGHISHLERNYSEKYLIWLQVLWPLASSSKFLIKCIILGSINTPTGTKFIWFSYRSLYSRYLTLASEVVFLKMPSRNQKKRSKQRAEYLQKREDILSQENKAKARARYKADPEKKKASVRDTYNANAVSKRAAKRQRYQEGVEENRAAKRQRYQEGVEENRAAKRQRYQEGVEENRAAKRQRYQEGVVENRAAKRQRYQEGVEENRAAKRHAAISRGRRGEPCC